jgi:uncharacterized protein YgiM (DUF1202 family)
MSNKEVFENTKVEIQKIKTEIKDHVLDEMNRLQEKRIARRDINLRFSPNNKSKRIGIITKGQDVYILKICHKWILIAYIDNNTKEPKSGFAYKKYFRREK